MNKKYITITLICIIVSVICGIIARDLLLGGMILATGFLGVYFASEGKRINYILGFINYFFMGYVAFKNNLFGIFFFYFFIFAPLQISGYISWKKNLNDNNSVKARSFSLKNSILITSFCVLGSFALGLLLSLIPGQVLNFMDASSNCTNLCGVVLMNLRFKEAWWIWLVNNIIDLIIWCIMVLNNGEGTIMMLVVSIVYLFMNILGIIKWNKEAKIKQED